MKNLKIGTRLGLAFGFIALLCALLAVLSLSKLAAIQNNLEDIVKDNNVKIKLTHKSVI